MAITTLAQTLGVTGVEKIIVTDIETDGDTGDKVREFRFVGEDDVVLLTIRAAGETESNILVTAPEQDF